MSRTLGRAKAGLIASSLSMLLSQSAFASMVNIHVPTPSVHISAPRVSVHAPGFSKIPVIHLKALLVMAKNHRTHHHGGDSVVTATVPGTDGGWHRDGHQGVTLPGSIVQPPGVGYNAQVRNSNPPGVYNLNCQGAADCRIVTQPAQAPVPNPQYSPTVVEQVPNLAGKTCAFWSNGSLFGITITAETVLVAGNIAIALNWTTPAYGTNIEGSMTENPNGTYNVTFQWTVGDETFSYTGTLTWSPATPGTPASVNPLGGAWSLSGATVVTNTSTGQVVPGAIGPSVGCTIS
jgi:hypothetical protein